MVINPLFLLLIAIGTGFYMAINIGANDVANSMGTSVGSGALSLRSAVVVAGVCTFLGAVLVGSHVTNTIRKGVIDPLNFVGNPYVLVWGMFAVLIGAGTWVSIATYLRLPVSTSHSIVGALIGFGLIEVGAGQINWGIVVGIISSWLISPLAGVLISYLIFLLIRWKILAVSHPLEGFKKIGFLLVGLVFFVLALTITYRGPKNLHLYYPLGPALGISALIAVVAGLASYLFLRRVPSRANDEYERVENFSKPLQVLSASYEAFGNGANDVANAVGPVAAIIAVLQTGTIGVQVPVPLWVLGLGGVGLVVGIATWGHRVMETIGEKITEVTPSRGFATEFGAATVVLIFSRLGMPVSTTHTSVGSVVGVGLARGIDALDLKILRNIVISWLITLPVAGALTAFIYLLFRWFF